MCVCACVCRCGGACGKLMIVSSSGKEAVVEVLVVSGRDTKCCGASVVL